MRKYIAFLRAINVGGHVVKMDHLRDLLRSQNQVAAVVFETIRQMLEPPEPTGKRPVGFKADEDRE